MPIIPLIMQADYNPDGWLGIILGSKIFVNFKRYPFEECMRRLLIELRAIFPGIEQNTNKIENLVPNFVKITDEVKIDLKTWKNEDVQNWCLKSEFHPEIINMLKNFTGEHLIQLNEIRKQSADYFYKEISNKYMIDLYSVVHFVNKFQKIF